MIIFGPLPIVVTQLSFVLALVLIYGSTIDSLWLFIPDRANLALLVSGIAATYTLTPDLLTGNIVAAIGVFISLALLSKAYVFIRKRTGLGLGDIKLVAASVPWVGTSGVSSVLFIGSLIGITLLLASTTKGKQLHFGTKLPFGPPLSLGLWITWLFGPVIVT